MGSLLSKKYRDIEKIFISNLAGQNEICGLTVSSSAFLLSEFFQHKKQTIYVLPTVEKAETFYNDFIFFRKYFNNRSDIDGNCGIHYLPPRDTDLFEELSPDHEISSKRIQCIFKMINSNGIFITTPACLLQYLMPREFLEDKGKNIDVGDKLDRDEFSTYLCEAGFTRRDFVEQRGDFSIRGGIIDFFSGCYDYPVRIELLGDEVVSIREFEHFSQRSIKKLLSTMVFPIREVVYDDNRNALLERFSSSFRKQLESPYTKIMREKLGKGEYFQGIENYLPLFYHSKSSLFDYMSTDAHIITYEKVSLLKIINDEYKKYESLRRQSADRGVPALPVDVLCLEVDQVAARLSEFKETNLSLIPADEESININIKRTDYLHIDESLRSDRFYSVAAELKKKRDSGYSVYITAGSQSRAERLIKMFMDYRLSVGIFRDKGIDLLKGTEFLPQAPQVIIGNLSEGFIFDDLRLAIVTEKDIFGKELESYRKKAVSRLKYSSTFESLKRGDYVVHSDYGIGKFNGLESMASDGRRVDFLVIEYQGGEKVYVPSDTFALVQRYIGIKGTKPAIDRLGGQSWKKRKERAQKAIATIAKELVELYAVRQTSRGFAFSPDDNWVREFESKFEYEETPHQIKAIEDIKSDMESSNPMDRLICGDVGYGKTEVAMRAAFKAVVDGKQVAVLVPTTILAHQHFKTFKDRFFGFPIRIEMLSRFINKSKQKEIMEEMEFGKIDIIIGTHAIVINRLRFKDLGLLVIDEEHRFGVMHKEKLKKIQKDVDVLTLTATPIPRTLQFSMMGIRDMSIIETPPEERLPVKTFVSAFNQNIIRKAILAEKERGGQIYFVHNRVQSISAICQFLEKLVPHIKIGIAHGQMKPSELEKIMINFVNKEFDLLLSTTIIESGIDIPSVNTIIINRADKLGLAQLYQLRGRVGRSRTQSFAYILVPSDRALTEDAMKRLRVIEELSDLGSGFKVSMHDLEIRGGGNILGEAQSGQIAAIGYELYCKLIKEVISEMRGKEVVKTNCVIELKTDALIPNSFIDDSMKRVSAYRRISEAVDSDELEELKNEFLDKYGPLPQSFEKLFMISDLRIKAQKIFIESIAEDSEGVLFRFSKQFKLSDSTLKKLLNSEQYRVKFKDSSSLLLKTDNREVEKADLALSFMEYLH